MLDEQAREQQAARERAARMRLVFDAQYERDLGRDEVGWLASMRDHVDALVLPRERRRATLEAIAALVWRGLLGG